MTSPDRAEPSAAEPGNPAEDPRATRRLRMALATNVAIVVLAGLVAVVLLVPALQRGI